MATYRAVFQTPADYAALQRLADRLGHTRFSSWPLQVPWAKKFPGAPEDDDFPVRRRRLLLYEGDEIRAFHSFLEHQLYLQGEPHSFVWPNGPLSEGIVDPRFATCYLVLMQHSLRLNPYHFFLGPPQNVAQMLSQLRWREVGTVPRFVLPLRAGKLLSQMASVRGSWKRRAAARLLSASGLASLALFAISGRKRVFRRSRGLEIQERNEFGPWTDAIWQAQVARYGAVTRRDAATLNRLYRPGDRRFQRLAVLRRGMEIGWLLCVTRFRQPPDWDMGYGDAPLAVIVDAFSAPEDARDVLQAGVERLADGGMALVRGTWSHRAWRDACGRLGFIRRPGQPLFISPAARKVFFTDTCPLEAAHFTEHDNDGPYYVAYDPDERPLAPPAIDP